MMWICRLLYLSAANRVVLARRGHETELLDRFSDRKVDTESRFLWAFLCARKAPRTVTPPSVSLVDRTGFECMRVLGISRAYALDDDFGG
jgi:hypothetical protein